MRLITFSLPAIALVAILSVSIQHSICYTRAQAEVELPAGEETTQILRLQLSKHNSERVKKGFSSFPQCLSAKAHAPVTATCSKANIVP